MKQLLTGFFCILYASSFSQSISDTINEEDAKRHIYYLASDKLRGRVNFTKEQLEAADYLSKELSSYGLKPFPRYDNYYQPFYFTRTGRPIAYIDSYTTDDTVLYNIVGILPGKSKPEEMIIFSAHYDHVNWGFSGGPGEIFNGANDDASGTAAVLMLARYFSMRHDNERTIVFCLFAGEELGLFGSAAFVRKADPDKIIADINIEMIGKTNYTGKNGFTVTGSEYSDLAGILKKNLWGDNVKIRKDGPDIAGLYYRSDNFSFAKKGIPAHSIMCSDDNDPCYHKPCDDAREIDTKNMTNIIRAIAKGSTTLISGSDTPWRTPDMSGVKSLEAFFSGIPIFKGFDACREYIAGNPLLGVDSITKRGIYSSLKPEVANHFPFPDSVSVKILLGKYATGAEAVKLRSDSLRGICIEAVFGNDKKGDKASAEVFRQLKNTLTSHYTARSGLSSDLLYFSKGENETFPDCFLIRTLLDNSLRYCVIIEYWGL